MFFSIAFVISIMCFYGIIKIMIPGKTDFTYTLSTAIYAFSPFTLGMIHDIYLDLLTIFLFTIAIYYYYSGKKLISVVMMIACIFTKEPCLIEVFCFVIGIYITELFFNAKQSSKHFLSIFSRANLVLLFFSVIMLYLYFTLSTSKWISSGGDGTKWTTKYMLSRLKVVGCLNYNWLISFFAILFVIIVISKHMYEIKYIVPIIVMYLGMLLFIIVFPTHNHARYMGAMIVTIYVLCGAELCSINRKSIRVLLQILTASIILISTFITIDPITKISFINIMPGKCNMISTGDFLSDSIVYNSQYEGYQQAVNEAIDSILSNESENAVICLPAVNSNTWYCDAIGTWKNVESSVVVKEYWNPITKLRYTVEQKNTVPLSITFVTAMADYRTIANGFNGHFVYASYLDEGEVDAIKKQCIITGEKDYSVNGWVLHDLKFKAKNIQ